MSGANALFCYSLQVQLVVLVSAFVMVSTVRSVSCLLFFYSLFSPCPAICKSGGGHVPLCPLESTAQALPTKGCKNSEQWGAGVEGVSKKFKWGVNTPVAVEGVDDFLVLGTALTVVW